MAALSGRAGSKGPEPRRVRDKKTNPSPLPLPHSGAWWGEGVSLVGGGSYSSKILAKYPMLKHLAREQAREFADGAAGVFHEHPLEGGQTVDGSQTEVADQTNGIDVI